MEPINTTDLLLDAAIELLQSGDDQGCAGLVVVTEDAYRRLQLAVRAIRSETLGIEIRPRRPKIFVTADLAGFLEEQIAKDAAGIPTTLGSALKALDTLSDDIVSQFYAEELKALIEKHGADFTVADRIES